MSSGERDAVSSGAKPTPTFTEDRASSSASHWRNCGSYQQSQRSMLRDETSSAFQTGAPRSDPLSRRGGEKWRMYNETRIKRPSSRRDTGDESGLPASSLGYVLQRSGGPALSVQTEKVYVTSANVDCCVFFHSVYIKASKDDLRSMLEQYGALAVLAIQAHRPGWRHIGLRAYATFLDARCAFAALTRLWNDRFGVLVNGRRICFESDSSYAHATRPHVGDAWPPVGSVLVDVSACGIDRPDSPQLSSTSHRQPALGGCVRPSLLMPMPLCLVAAKAGLEYNLAAPSDNKKAARVLLEKAVIPVQPPFPGKASQTT